MTMYQYKNHQPKVGSECFIADSADVIGRVELADRANIWFQTVVRGDVNKIVIGENTNIQDLSILHVVEEFPLIIGKNVTVGHSVILHACEIGDGSLIGMGAKILDGAKIGKNCLVAAGSVVPPGKSYPDGSFIIGSPAKVKRELSEAEIEQYSNHYKTYLITKDEFLNDVKKI